jgi:hypothetical protein
MPRRTRNDGHRIGRALEHIAWEREGPICRHSELDIYVCSLQPQHNAICTVPKSMHVATNVRQVGWTRKFTGGACRAHEYCDKCACRSCPESVHKFGPGLCRSLTTNPVTINRSAGTVLKVSALPSSLRRLCDRRCQPLPERYLKANARFVRAPILCASADAVTASITRPSHIVAILEPGSPTPSRR